jgi:hypothetical protein
MGDPWVEYLITESREYLITESRDASQEVKGLAMEAMSLKVIFFSPLHYVTSSDQIHFVF